MERFQDSLVTRPVVSESSEHAEPQGAFEVFSRFNRDQGTWIALTDAALYPLALDAVRRRDSDQTTLRCWSCGCSSGEEAYYLRMIWQRRFAQVFPEVDLTVIGTDTSAEQIDNALRGVYPAHSVQGLPADWQREFFHLPADGPTVKSRWGFVGNSTKSYVEQQRLRNKQSTSRPRSRNSRTVSSGADAASTDEGSFQLSDAGGVRQAATFLHQDASEEMPDGPFDIICSRYAVCLYMEHEQKAEVLAAMVQRLRPGGFLVVGRKDRLPEGFCRSNGLSQVVYRVEDEFCPYGPDQLLEDIYRKDVEPMVDGQQRAEFELADPRFKASTYVEYLSSIGQVPDWVADRERIWVELRTQRMTEKSRRLLEKACLEGRRADEGPLINRMARDFEDRQERQRAREARKLRDDEAASLRTQQALSKEEASTKVQRFFDRLQQDLAQREAAILDAQKSQQQPLHPPRRRNRRRTSTLSAGAKTRRVSAASRTRAPKDTSGISNSDVRARSLSLTKARTH